MTTDDHWRPIRSCLSQAVSASTFPELHKALYAHLTPPHLTPPAAHERDLSSTPRPGLPPPSPSASSPSAASSLAPSPASTPDARYGASPFASTRIPSAGSARPARPASAGGNGLKLAGLSSLPREDPYPPEPGTARDEPASAVPGGMPKLGGGGGGMSKLNLGKISSDHRAEDDGSMSQHERLRIYAKQCSQILPNLYLGADEVAKDLTVR